MKKISIDIGNKKEKIDAHRYYINSMSEISPIIVENISSRDMYQALNDVAIDAKYDVNKDVADGTVDGFYMVLSRYNNHGINNITIFANFPKMVEYISNEANKNQGTFSPFKK